MEYFLLVNFRGMVLGFYLSVLVWLTGSSLVRLGGGVSTCAKKTFTIVNMFGSVRQTLKKKKRFSYGSVICLDYIFLERGYHGYHPGRRSLIEYIALRTSYSSLLHMWHEVRMSVSWSLA